MYVRNGYKQQNDLLNSLLLNIEMLMCLRMDQSSISCSYMELYKWSCSLAVERKGKGAQCPSKLRGARYSEITLPVYPSYGLLVETTKTCCSLLFWYRQELAQYFEIWKLVSYQTPNSCFLFNQLLNFCMITPPISDLDKLGLLGNLFRNCGVHGACGNGC